MSVRLFPLPVTDAEVLPAGDTFAADFEVCFADVVFTDDFDAAAFLPAVVAAAFVVPDFLVAEGAELRTDAAAFFVGAAFVEAVFLAGAAFADAVFLAGTADAEAVFLAGAAFVEAVLLAETFLPDADLAAPLSSPVALTAEAVAPATAPEAAAARISAATSFAFLTTLLKVPFVLVFFLVAISLSPFWLDNIPRCPADICLHHEDDRPCWYIASVFQDTLRKIVFWPPATPEGIGMLPMPKRAISGLK